MGNFVDNILLFAIDLRNNLIINAIVGSIHVHVYYIVSEV